MAKFVGLIILPLIILFFFFDKKESDLVHKYSLGDCFSGAKWTNETGEPSGNMDNTILRIVRKNKSSYTVRVYSLKNKKYIEGGFSLKEESFIKLNTIQCPIEIQSEKF